MYKCANDFFVLEAALRFCKVTVVGVCTFLICTRRVVAQLTPEPCQPLVQVSAGEMRSYLLHQVMPEYGPVVRQTGVNGAMLFRVLVGCDGHVFRTQIVSGPEALRQATIDAVTQWVYCPYLIGGKPAAVEFTAGLSMNFGATVLYEVVAQDRVRVSSGVMAGHILSKQAPTFPPLPTNSHLSGPTVLHAVIGKDGHVLELTPVSGPELIRDQVMNAVRRWRYKPFLVDGHPVEVETTITLNIDFGG